MFELIRRQLAFWREYRKIVRELESLDDHELLDIGISRYDIYRIARDSAQMKMLELV